MCVRDARVDHKHGNDMIRMKRVQIMKPLSVRSELKSKSQQSSSQKPDWSFVECVCVCVRQIRGWISSGPLESDYQ